MAVLAEITELLRRWDVWKRVEAAPGRVDALEKRISELESKLKQPPGEACPKCGEASYKVEKSVPDPIFGRVGGRRYHMKCSACGFAEEKLVTS